MKTTKQALIDHRETFWAAKTNADCYQFMAAEAQLMAQLTREQNGFPGYAKRHDDYAREVMGITDGDQLYA